LHSDWESTFDEFSRQYVARVPVGPIRITEPPGHTLITNGHRVLQTDVIIRGERGTTARQIMLRSIALHVTLKAQLQ